jgi:hypothetical protein
MRIASNSELPVSDLPNVRNSILQPFESVEHDSSRELSFCGIAELNGINKTCGDGGALEQDE